MDDEIRDIFIFIIVAFLFVFMAEFPYYTGGVTVFTGDVSQDTTFHVDLIKDRRYEVWVLDAAGPETVNVSIRNGQDSVYEGSFRLLHPEGDYVPWHPCFWAKDTETHDIVVHPVGPGTVRMIIRKDAGQNSSQKNCAFSRSAGQG